MKEVEFTKGDAAHLSEFLKTDTGAKVMQTLDNMAEEKNNLLQTVNLVSGSFKPEQTGIRCQMVAAEVRAIYELKEHLNTLAKGNYHADEN